MHVKKLVEHTSVHPDVHFMFSAIVVAGCMQSVGKVCCVVM